MCPRWYPTLLLLLSILSWCIMSVSKPAIHKAIDGKNLNFLFFGDWGMKGENQTLVGHSMGKWAADNNASFLVALGDNFYFDGVKNDTDPLWNTIYRNVYTDASLNIPWYAILGNHDYYENPQAQIDYYTHQRDHRWTMPDYVFQEIYEIPNTNGKTLEIVFVDTPVLAPEQAPPTSAGGVHEVNQNLIDKQLSKIESYLSKSLATWLFVAGHYPIYSEGEHGDTQSLIDRLVPLMHRYGVQVYMNGHDHLLQHISWQGIEYITSGQGALTNHAPAGTFEYNTQRPSVATAGFQFGSLGPGFATTLVSEEILQIDLRNKEGVSLHTIKVANPRDASQYPTESEYSSRVKDIFVSVALVLIGMMGGIWVTWVIFKYELQGLRDAYEKMLECFRDDGVCCCVQRHSSSGHGHPSSSSYRRQQFRRSTRPIPLSSAESSEEEEDDEEERNPRNPEEFFSVRGIEEGSGLDDEQEGVATEERMKGSSSRNSADNEIELVPARSMKNSTMYSPMTMEEDAV